MKKKSLAKVAILAALSILALAACRLARESIIISLGIRAYGMLRIALVSVSACFAAALVVIFVIILIWRKKPGDKDQPMTDAERRQMRKSLEEFEDDKWICVYGISPLCEQLDSIDRYQENLRELLEKNSGLGGKPIEIMDTIGRSMYANIKKLLNYMQALDEGDSHILGGKVDECRCKNEALLKKAKDFMVAVVDYVNRDMREDGGETAMEQMNSYMYVVLDAMEKEDIYLK